MTSEVSNDLHARAGQPSAAPDWFCAPVLSGLDAELLLKAIEAGYTWSLRARLPEGGHEQVGSSATRDGALVAGFEDLVAWCGEQKEIGGKRHRKQAEQLQEWALQQERLVGVRDVVVAAETTATAAATPDAQQFAVEWVPIEDICESPWNPRQVYPEKEMAELVESMRTGGFRPWQPLVGRPVGETSECWRPVGGAGRRLIELGAGHRRSRAAQLAGIALVPVVVREMSDAEFLKLLNFDNSGREDVHPLHEAGGWRMLMEKTGMGVADIAAHIGQSKAYVYQRLKYADLIDAARQAFLDEEISARHAILIARLEPKAQEKALAYAIREDWQGHRPSHRALEQWLRQEEFVDLDGCVFDLGDRMLLAGAGACDDCPKRGKNMPGFEPETPEDVCTDRSCYSAKTDNHLVRIKKSLQEGGAEVVMISGTWGPSKKGVLTRSEYETVEGGAKGALQALIVDGSEAGKVVAVRVKPKQSTGSSAEQRAKLEREEKQRTAKIEREGAVRRAILAAVRPKIAGLMRADLEALLVTLLHNSEDGDMLCEFHGIEHEAYGGEQALIAALPKLREAEIFQLCVEVSVMEDFSRWNMDGRQEPKALMGLAKRYKVDATKVRATVEEQAKAAEGGKRLEVEKAKGKKVAPVKKAAPVKKVAAKKGGKK